MKRNFLYQQLPLVLLCLGLVFTASSWQGHPQKTKINTIDTVPDTHKKVTDIDDALDQLEKSRTQMERSLQDIDWKKIQNSVKNAQIDVEKIKTQIAETMKAVDVGKLNTEIQNSMKDIDMKKVQTSIDKAMKEVDIEKLKANLDASMAKIDMEKIKQEIEKASTIDMRKVEEEMKNIGPQIEKSMKDATLNMEKAKTELKMYKSFIENLDRDGLIDKTKNYTIEYKNGALTINGKKQPAEVMKKYSSFLQNRKEFRIKKDEDGFNIND
jgi:hypothetical protein